MITIHEVTQGTTEWKELRKGKLTASRAGDLLQYGLNKALEESDFSGNWYTQRGSDLEHEAIELYEKIYKVDVQRPGFITNDKYPNCGASPDGITDVYIEVKCFNTTKHLSITKYTIPFEIIAQIQFGLMITEIDKAHLVLYNPDVEVENALRIITLSADKRIHKRFREKLKEGKGDGEKENNS